MSFPVLFIQPAHIKIYVDLDLSLLITPLFPPLHFYLRHLQHLELLALYYPIKYINLSILLFNY